LRLDKDQSGMARGRLAGGSERGPVWAKLAKPLTC